MVKGRVSILIPCYNCEKYLHECLDSIVKQKYDNIETIIINDGSTDGSEKIIDSYVDIFKSKNKKLIKINQSNLGQAAACNNGLKYINGEYLYWQDSDDVLEKDAITHLVDFLDKNHDYDMVRGNVAFRNEKTFNKIEHIGKPYNPLKQNIFSEYLFEKKSYCFAGIFMVRMSYFDKCNPDRKIYISEGGQNYQFLLPITYKGKCGYLNKIVYNCRIRDNSHSHSVKSLKDKLKRCNIYKEIIFNTLDIIHIMPSYKKNFYKICIHIKYFIRKIKIIIKCIIYKCLKNKELNLI